jgi:excisionase family DNA binding protein
MATSDETRMRLLTVREASRATGLQVWRLYQELAEGTGPAHMRVGRTIRISAGSLLEWIEARQQLTGPSA